MGDKAPTSLRRHLGLSEVVAAVLFLTCLVLATRERALRSSTELQLQQATEENQRLIRARLLGFEDSPHEKETTDPDPLRDVHTSHPAGDEANIFAHDDSGALRHLTGSFDCSSCPCTTETTTNPDWHIIEGSGCEMWGSDCIQSDNYPNGYSSNSSCIIAIASTNQYALGIEDFQVAAGSGDKLTVGGIEYGGDTSTLPTFFAPQGGRSIYWTTDGSDSAAGWRVCLRSTCSGYTCSGGALKADAAEHICSDRECRDVDDPECCSQGCNLPPVVSDAYTVPEGCTYGNTYSVRDCTIGCAGDTEIDAWSPPQTCDNGTFTLPVCKAASPSEWTWVLDGKVRQYNSGCVASLGVGESYGPNEIAKISYIIPTGTHWTQYRQYFTYLDTEANKDELIPSIFEGLPSRCSDASWYQHNWYCYYANYYIDDFAFANWAARRSGRYSEPVGPYPANTLIWTSDQGGTTGTGFILCVQAQCDATSCPEGYRFNCTAKNLWCSNHDCSSSEDVDQCCVAESQEDANQEGYVFGEARGYGWCVTRTTTTTTTPSIFKPDVVGHMILTLTESGATRTLEDVEAILHTALEQLGDVGYWDVFLMLNVSTDSYLAFRVEQTDVQLESLTNEEYMAAFNNQTQIVEAITHRVMRTAYPGRDHYGFRKFGSNCEDLYRCDWEGSSETCFVEIVGNTACAYQNEEDYCGARFTAGRGFTERIWWPPAPTFEHWLAATSWDVAQTGAFGDSTSREACCSCGGGTCASGFFRIFDTSPRFCIPCGVGTSSQGGDADSCDLCQLGRFAANEEASACDQCPSGRYADVEGLNLCKLCDAGMVTLTAGKESCDECPPGTTSSSQRDECVPCAPGHFAAANGTSACEACPHGQFTDATGATECSLCGVGTFAGNLGRTECDPCGRGKYSDTLGLSACEDCSPGRAQDLMQQTACELCDVGFFARQSGESECQICEAGTESTEAGASACQRCEVGWAKAAGELNCSQCDAGTFSAETGLTACRTCARGWHADAPMGAVACVECEPGRHGTSDGLTACPDCPVGFFSAEERMTSCIDCSPGEFGNVTGLSACYQCRPGSFTPVAGEFMCEECSVGHQSPTWGSTQCDLCLAGRHAPGRGTEECMECDAGWFSPLAGATACVICERGRHSETSGQSECPYCEPGWYAETAGATRCTGCNDTLPGVAEYWTTMRPPTNEDPVRASGIQAWSELRGAYSRSSCGCRPGTQPDGDVCRECGEGLICLGMGVLEIKKGYSWDRAFSTWDCDNAIKDACPGGVPGLCKSGRDPWAVACAVCLPNFIPGNDGICKECGDTDTLVPSLALAFTILAAIGLYFIFDSPVRKRPRLSFLLIVASFGQAVTIIQQLGIISLIRVDWTHPLLSVFEFISGIVFFDWEVLRPACIADISVVRMYFLRVLMVFFCLFCVCVAHGASQLYQHRHDWRTRWPSLCCALGTIILTFFVSIVSTMLGPFQCQGHPNGRRTVTWYPSVVCWDGGNHTTMIVIGGCACLLPLIFLCMSIWAVREFPRRLRIADTRFINKWAFLFFRYSTEAYWYGPVMLARNAMVSAVPVLTSPVIQVLFLEVLMVFSMMLLLRIMPWRVKQANYLDTVGHFCLLLVSMMASFYVDEDNMNFISTFAVVMICALPGFLFITVAYGMTLLLRSMKRPFQFFLCHHKLGAGCFCRLLKLWLLQTSGVDRKVFIDSDDLKNLDKLFDVVAHQTETLVAVNTANLLTRPWCIGEITTAHRSHVRVLPVYAAGVSPSSMDFIENFGGYVDISSLAPFGIELAMIQEALKWFASLGKRQLPLEIQDSALEALSRALVGGKVIDETLPAMPLKTGNSRPEVLILSNKLDIEAASTAMILRNLLNPIIQHQENSLAFVLSIHEQVPDSIKRGMLICTNGVFTEHVLGALMACKAKGAILLPIMSVTNFVFPSEAWMREQEVFSNLPHDQSLVAMRVVQAIFSEIAIDFQPSALSGTEATLNIKAREIAIRIFSQMSSLGEKVSDLDRRTKAQPQPQAPMTPGRTLSSNLKTSGKASSATVMEIISAELELGIEKYGHAHDAQEKQQSQEVPGISITSPDGISFAYDEATDQVL